MNSDADTPGFPPAAAQYTIDLSAVKDKDDLHALLAEALPLPAHYGRNLDALYDCLTEAHAVWNIRFTGCTQAEATLGGYFMGLQETFADAQKFTDSITATFV